MEWKVDLLCFNPCFGISWAREPALPHVCALYAPVCAPYAPADLSTKCAVLWAMVWAGMGGVREAGESGEVGGKGSMLDHAMPHQPWVGLTDGALLLQRHTTSI